MFPTLRSLVDQIGLAKGDCHPELPRDKEFKGLGLGGGAISIEEALLLAGIIAVHKPDVILELGTAMGASALALGAVCVDLKKGKVITVDMAKSAPESSKIMREMKLPIEYVIDINSLDYLENFVIDPKKRYLVFSDTDIQVRPDEVRKVLQKFPKGTMITVHDTSDKHPFGPMELKKKFENVAEFPSPRGISVLTV
jgi:predicted O-methyltransferase YrrM